MADAIKLVSPKKVYIIFGVQIVSAVIMILCFSYFLEGMSAKQFSLVRIDLICSYLILVITVVCLAFSKAARKTIPINYVMCAFSTFVLNYLVAVVACRYDFKIILIGLVLAFLISIISSAIGYSSILNLVPKAGPLCLIVMLLVLAETIGSFFEEEKLDITLGVLSLICYFGCLIYATELTFSKNLDFAYPDYEYIFAAIFLYIITLFIIYRAVVLCSYIITNADELNADHPPIDFNN